MTRADFDVGILGGGPAGAAMASYLAKAGVRCVVFEREIYPRPHVGESLVPAANRVLGELGLFPQLEQEGFIRKYGAAWTAATAKVYHHLGFDGLPEDCRVDVCFDERKQAGVDLPYTYHVDRGRFDLLLLQHAHRLGATVYEGIAVQGVDFTGPLPRVRFTLGRKKTSVSVQMVVDASGRRTLLGRQLKLKVNDPVFDQFAVHSWFEGFDRGTEEKSDYIFIHFLPLVNTWIWQIPITESITSIGVVTQKKNFTEAAARHEDFFWQCIGSRADLLEKLRASAQIRPFTVEADYSYQLREICGDRFVLIGDAARFVDPIFSSGVSIALNGARMASWDILRAFEDGSFLKESFASYASMVRRGLRNWYEFICLYYRLNVLFTVFINDPRYRLDVLQLLQGDVFDDERPQVLEEMRRIVTEVEENEKHFWHPLLGSLTANAVANALNARSRAS